MKSKFILCLALVLSGYLFGCSTTTQHNAVSNVEIDKNLTEQISSALIECQKIKTGMTRAELMKIFTTEGGLSTANHRTYVYRKCPYIKVDVDFTPSVPILDMEKPADIIVKISRPYLDWNISD